MEMRARAAEERSSQDKARGMDEQFLREQRLREETERSKAEAERRVQEVCQANSALMSSAYGDTTRVSDTKQFHP